MRNKIAAWAEIAAKAEAELNSLAELSGEAEKLRAVLMQKLKEHDVSRMPAIQEAEKNGWMALGAYEKLEPFYENLREHYLPNLRDLSRPELAERLSSRKYAIYDLGLR